MNMFLQIQLIRIELRVPEYGWTTQKVFHLMNFIVNGGDLEYFTWYFVGCISFEIFSLCMHTLQYVLLCLAFTSKYSF